MNTQEKKAKRPWGTGCIFKPKGSRFFWIKYSRHGRVFKESTKSEKETVAKNLLKQRTGEMVSNTFIAPADRHITVDDLYESLLTNYRKNGWKSLEGTEQRWQAPAKDGEKAPEAGRLKQFFSGMLAMDVTSDELDEYVNEQLDAGLGKATINRDLAALRRAFHLAKRAKKIHDMPNFDMLEEPAARQGFVEESDYAKLAANTRELWMRALLATAYTFGFRKGELLGLRVSQVDLADRTITLKAGETKSGEGRFAVMTQDVFTLISACIAGKAQTDYVFTRGQKPVKDFRGAWDTLAEAAGKPGLLFHDLRRSAVRNMVRRGIPELVAMKISGHKTRSVFDRYNITSGDDIREAARKIEAGKATQYQDSTSFESQAKQENVSTATNHVN